jgi:hypothetical protein
MFVCLSVRIEATFAMRNETSMKRESSDRL